MMSTFGMILLIMDLAALVESYSIDYFDCRTPKGISRYDVSQACKEERMNDPVKQTYYLLQRKEIKKLKGYSCSVIKSSFLLYCGAFSHQKFAEVPKIEITQEVTRLECQTMVQSKFFQTLEGTKHRIKMNTENVFSVTEKGMIRDEDNAVSCQGETVKVHDQLFDNMILVSQYKITVLEEDYIIQDGQVETLRDHLILDAELRRGGLFTNGKFFYWTFPSAKCMLEKIRTMQMTKEDGLFIDHDNKILFDVQTAIPAPPNCPDAKIYPTEYKEFYLTKNKEFKKSVDVLRIADFISNRDNYLAFILEKKIKASRMKMQKNMCTQVYKENRMIPFGSNNDTFAKVEGDLLMTFKCKSQTAKLRITPECYEDIPIQEEGFVNPGTRIYQKHSAVTPCNTHFPMTIHAREGWVQLSTSIVPVQPPRDKMFIEEEVEHEDLSHGGLYTKEETNSWSALIEYSNFHQAITQKLTFGACKNLGECSSQQSSQYPSYNLQKLVDETVEGSNPFVKIDQALTKYGAYISAFVLLIWTIKFVIFTVTMTLMMMQEGVTGALALFFSTFCGTIHRRNRIREFSKKDKPPRPYSKDYEESSFLSTPTTTFTAATNYNNPN